MEIKYHAPKRKICLALGMSMYYYYFGMRQKNKKAGGWNSETFLGQ